MESNNRFFFVAHLCILLWFLSVDCLPNGIVWWFTNPARTCLPGSSARLGKKSLIMSHEVLVILFLWLRRMSMYLVWWWPDCWIDVEIPLKALQPLKQLLFRSIKISYMILLMRCVSKVFLDLSGILLHHVPSRWDPSSRGDQMSGISSERNCTYYFRTGKRLGNYL